VTDPGSAVEAGRRFYDERVDAVCVVAASWFEDYLVLDMLEECHLPLIAWARPGMETGSLCGMQQLGFILKQLGWPYCFLFDEVSSEGGLCRAYDFAAGAALRQRLRRARIGYLGHRVEGMTETTGHELALKKMFGPRVVGIDSGLFMERVEKGEKGSLREKWEELKNRVGSIKCADEDGMESLQAYAVLKSIIEEMALDALAVGCYPNLMGKVCLAASLLGEEGIPIACEGDLNGALGMLILSWLSGQPTHNTDLLDPIEEDNTIVFSHCGSGAFSLAKDPSEIALAPVRLMDRGLCCLFTAKPGPVTLINIIPTVESYKVGIVGGEAVETEMVFPGNPLRVYFDLDYREVLNWIRDEGLGHHWMAAYGDLRRGLTDFASMAGCHLTLLK
jgi:L-fucose isomerase-like protein